MRVSLWSFFEDAPDLEHVSAKLMDWSLRAHRQGVLALDAELDAINEPYLRQALALAVDGVDVAPLRTVLVAESRAREADDDTSVRVLETAAGYAPTFGMLGAVLGLMQVMSALDEPGRLGGGIATAFVATVYGLTLANAVLLPLAGRLRERLMAGARRRELILDAVVALRQRTHPRLVAATIRGLTPQESWSGLPMTSPAAAGRAS
jgi:chemotaxis protein MotA